jgi:hypothetical protein
MQLIAPYFPIVLSITMFFLLWVFLFAFRKYYRYKKLRLPFTQLLLRSPGQSLLKKIDLLDQEVAIYTVYLFSAPLLFYATYISLMYFDKKKP